MKKTIDEIKQLLYAALAHAPEEAECTKETNEMFADMQNLKESIEFWQASGAVIYDESEPDEDDYASIEMEDVVANAATRFEYDDEESARLRVAEIQAILENENLDDDEAHDFLVEQELLQEYLDSLEGEDE